ncbi:PRC-barrel domain containing protein [Glaciecola siphonariae]|uniref:PRC-barrel domain containing protein n=1 Tax=Glaciecola siphonariae TaxID=521012 RepID=A0ABV9LZ12_9ALTE
MNISLNSLLNYDIEALDGDIGFIKDVLFDDQQWAVRYLTVDTKRWMPLSKKVLITPISLQLLNVADEKVHVSLSKEDVQNSPSIETHKPVSRQFEEVMFDFFGYGYYWNGLGLWGDFQNPLDLAQQERLQTQHDAKRDKATPSDEQDPHLRSIDELKHYNLVETDGMQGHVHDFILDTDSWRIKYLVIDTRNWLPGGRKTLLPPEYLESVSWKDQAVFCELNKQQIKQIPEFDQDKINNEDYLASVHDVFKAF